MFGFSCAVEHEKWNHLRLTTFGFSFEDVYQQNLYAASPLILLAFLQSSTSLKTVQMVSVLFTIFWK